MEESSITFTLTNLALPKLEVLNTTRNDTNNTSSATGEDGLPSPFFLTGIGGSVIIINRLVRDLGYGEIIMNMWWC